MSYGSTPPPPPPPVSGPAFGPAGSPPNNNLVLAILSTVLCCLPTGIYAIIQAAKVNQLWTQGDVAGAQKAAAEARKWSIIGAVAGVAIGAVYVLVFVILAASSTSTTG